MKKEKLSEEEKAKQELREALKKERESKRKTPPAELSDWKEWEK